MNGQPTQALCKRRQISVTPDKDRGLLMLCQEEKKFSNFCRRKIGYGGGRFCWENKKPLVEERMK